jgi:hypothetical protein
MITPYAALSMPAARATAPAVVRVFALDHAPGLPIDRWRFQPVIATNGGPE